MTARRVATRVLEDAVQEGRATAERALGAGAERASQAVQERLTRIVGVVEKATGGDIRRFVGVNESEILTFVPDRRSMSGLAAMMLGFFFLTVLPPGWKALSTLFFLAGVAYFLVGYVRNAKVDVPEGYEGVVCRFGRPVRDRQARRGRNWHLWYPFFIPFLVSQRDQVVDTNNAGYTGDFASISLRNQITLRVTDSPTFITNTSPASLMKIVNFYTSYIVLRMIVSVSDSRVKFMGRDRLDNLSHALNRYLSEPCGVSAVRATMPDSENPILDDLENVRTGLKGISAMTEKKQVRLEAEVKVVESSIRRERKAARNEALQLQQQRITLETHITEEVNTRRQELLIKARQRLEESLSKVQEEMATWKAKVQKALAIKESRDALERDLDLRIARLKRAFLERLIPDQVQVLGVAGIGTGFGLSLGNRLLQRITDPSDEAPPSAPRLPEEPGGQDEDQ
jgi:regulator of protease activity HflC (stomatin/prohibitin superfamily)